MHAVTVFKKDFFVKTNIYNTGKDGKIFIYSI